MLDAWIRFFDIKKCGFFLHGQTVPKFGGVDDTLVKLNNWATDGRQFINTTCYEADPDNDVRNTYFCGWHKDSNTKDSLLILWNETSNDNGTIYGMKPLDPPGISSMLTTGFEDVSAIPGSPSYFWFIPSRNIFATIRFTHSVQGKINLDRYLNGFLLNKSPYRVKDDSTEKIVGFSANGQMNDSCSDIMPKFVAAGQKKDDLKTELVQNIGKIRKIIKREKLSYTTQTDRSMIERIFSGLLSNAPTFTKSHTITHELQFRPTKPELIQIIDKHSESAFPSSISEIGFEYNDGKRIMLNGTGFTFPVKLKVTRSENQIIRPNILLASLNEQKSEILNLQNQEPHENT